MITFNGKRIEIGNFPDGTILIKQGMDDMPVARVEWFYENDREFVCLIYLVKHLRNLNYKQISLFMPYIPNARQDRVKSREDVFTLKYFAEVLNSLEINSVKVLDAHSYVSLALINNVSHESPMEYIGAAIKDCQPDMLFFPDEGAMKRYSDMIPMPYAFGIKKRDWATGKIQGLDVSGCTYMVNGKNVLIVDDICSRGGTFYHSAKKLKELGANNVYLYVTHCENTILDGELFTSGLIEKVYTTSSIFTKEHEKIEVFKL